MPWLIRLIGSMVIYRFIARRMRGGPMPGRPMPKVNFPIRDLVDDVGLGTHLAAATGAGLFALLAGAVATTLLILGPRWLGGIIAALAIAAVGVTWWQVRSFSRLLRTRSWRHRKIVITGDEETRDAS